MIRGIRVREKNYMLELTASELHYLKSKILISKVSPKNRKPTKVFTERGLFNNIRTIRAIRGRKVGGK